MQANHQKESPSYSHDLTLIPRSQDKVIGREPQLNTIRNRLNTNNVPIVLVNGIGGIGKTTVALEYIRQYGKDYDHVAWIEVTDSIATAFVTNIPLIRNLQLQAELAALPIDTYEAQAFECILYAFNQLPNCLLVIDNANNADDLQACRPRLSSLRATTLLTSRAQPEHWSIVHIDELAPEAAIELFMTHYRFALEDEQVPLLRELLQRLGHHTLLIELLAKAANKARLSFVALCQKVKDNYLHDPELNAQEIAIGDHAERTRLQKKARIEHYIKMTFQEISTLDETEQRYLRYLCLLPSNEYLETELMTYFQIDADQKTEFLSTLDGLTQKGWLAQRLKDPTYAYKLHSVLQDVAIQELGVSYALCAPVISYWIDALYIDQTKDNPVDKFALLPFSEFLMDKLHKEDDEFIIDLFDHTGIIKWHLGKYTEAVQLLEKALEKAVKLYSEKNEVTVRIQSNLATVYQALGQYEQARNLLEKALASDIKNFGAKHSNVAVLQSNLAVVYQALGQYEYARYLLEKALAVDLDHFGAKHPKVAADQSNLATVYQALGQYERAQNLLEKALDSDLQNFGKYHPSVATRYNNLIAVYVHFAAWDKAQEAADKNLDICLQVLGSEHPATKRAECWRDWLAEQLGG